jgi:glutamate-1-semialdehyde 2,1-aminomutase
MRALYRDVDATWNARAAQLNARLAAAAVPVRVANLSSIWTIYYEGASRYNWMFQYYLRAAGLGLSWVGTGRLIFSLNFSAADYAAVADALLSAAQDMQRDGWWWTDSRGGHPQLTNKSIRRRLLKEMLQAKWQAGRRPAHSTAGRPYAGRPYAGRPSMGRPSESWSATSPIGSISSPRSK